MKEFISKEHVKAERMTHGQYLRDKNMPIPQIAPGVKDMLSKEGYRVETVEPAPTKADAACYAWEGWIGQREFHHTYVPIASDPKEQILRHFEPYLNASVHDDIFETFQKLAMQMVARTLRGPERAAGLRKLIEARECFVRATRGMERR